MFQKTTLHHPILQCDFIASLRLELESHDQSCREVRHVLERYTVVPTTMADLEWGEVGEAITVYYSAARLLYRVSQLLAIGVIDIELLIIWGGDTTQDRWYDRLHELTRWCGTGLDLASNYDCYKLAHMITEIRSLMVQMNTTESSMFSGLEDDNKILIESFDSQVEQFMTHLAEHDISSEQYLDRYILDSEYRKSHNHLQQPFPSYPFRVTVRSEEKAILNCLWTLGSDATKTGNMQIVWGGDPAFTWETGKYELRCQFTEQDDRNRFIAESTRSLGQTGWRILKIEDDVEN